MKYILGIYIPISGYNTHQEYKNKLHLCNIFPVAIPTRKGSPFNSLLHIYFLKCIC